MLRVNYYYYPCISLCGCKPMAAVFKKNFANANGKIQQGRARSSKVEQGRARSSRQQLIDRATVDKQWDIHSVRCAKLVDLEDRLNLSHNRPVYIPPFYRHFLGCQVLDLVDKFDLIHKNLETYYYYQKIYIQIM